MQWATCTIIPDAKTCTEKLGVQAAIEPSIRPAPRDSERVLAKCAKDTDCRDERICEAGQCVQAEIKAKPNARQERGDTSTLAPNPAPSPAPTASSLGNRGNTTLAEATKPYQLREEDVRKTVIKILLADGHIDPICADTDRGNTPVVKLRSVDLNADGRDDYIVEGNKGCTYGARTPYYWVFSTEHDRLMLILDAGPLDSIGPTKKRTNGYFDLEAWAMSGSEAFRGIFRYANGMYQYGGKYK